MTNLKKIGLTALAGTLAATTFAQAGELTVGGTARMEYQSTTTILAVPLTESSPAIAYEVAASVPAKAVKPIFLKFVINTPFVIFVITNSVFLTKCFFF